MNYQSRIWNPTAGQPIDSAFLSEDAERYLAGCTAEIYADWDKHFPKEKSLAGVLSRTVLKKLETPNFAISPEISRNYHVRKAFHHQKSMSDLLVEIFNAFNNESVPDFLIITQTANFKERFLYDSATMTFQSLSKHYGHFIKALNLDQRPRLFFLAFQDLPFRTDVLNRGAKRFLKLEVA